MSTGVALELLGHDTTIFGKDFSYIDGEDVGQRRPDRRLGRAVE